jgi:hypothetical protein
LKTLFIKQWILFLDVLAAQSYSAIFFISQQKKKKLGGTKAKQHFPMGKILPFFPWSVIRRRYFQAKDKGIAYGYIQQLSAASSLDRVTQDNPFSLLSRNASEGKQIILRQPVAIDTCIEKNSLIDIFAREASATVQNILQNF